MKPSTLFSLLAALLVAASLAVGGAASAATITIVADEWCPYNCEPGDEKPGYMIEIAQRALAAAGHDVEYRTMPWSRAIEEARRGRFDAIVGAAHGDAPDFVFPEHRMGVSANVFLVKRGNPWRFDGLDSLQQVSLGTIRDYSYGDPLDEYIAGNERDETRIQIVSGGTALDTNMRKLLAGRIDVLVEDRNVVEHALAGSELADAFEIAGDLGEDDLFVAFSPAAEASDDYARLIDEGMQRLRASGELAAILRKYGVKDWQ
jgi:polar amino acid transport system substrate-binding protein